METAGGSFRRQSGTQTSGPGAAQGPLYREGPAGRAGGAGGDSRAAGRRAAPPRSADRASAPDPGPLRLPFREPSRGARGGDAPRHGRGLRGRDLLRPFRRGHGGREPAAAADGARLRQPDLRMPRRAGAAGRAAEGGGRRRAGGAGALHGPLRGGAGGRGRPSPCNRGERGLDPRLHRRGGPCARHSSLRRLRRLCRRRRLRRPRGVPVGRPQRRRRDRGAGAERPQGKGGAGFPTGRKWRFVRAETGPA